MLRSSWSRLESLEDRAVPAVDLLVVGGSFGGLQSLVRVDSAGGTQTLVSSGGSFNNLTAVAVEAGGGILVADVPVSGTPEIIRVDPATGAQTVVSSGGLLGYPGDLAVAPNGDILVADAGGVVFGGTGSVIRVNPVTGTQALVSTGGHFVDPVGIALEADGNILVADPNADALNTAVFRVNPVTGAQTILSSAGDFGDPTGVALEANGSVLVVDANAFDGTGGVFRVNPVTGAQTTLAAGGSLIDPLGIAVGPGGIYVADANALGGSVLRIDPVTGVQTPVSVGGMLVEPRGVAVAPALPTVSVGGARLTEGNSGTKTATVAVTLSAASPLPVIVSYATRNGTATAGSDYGAVSGTLTFAPGETTRQIPINVSGDLLIEPTETFSVTLSGAVIAGVGSPGTVTIVTDDPAWVVQEGDAFDDGGRATVVDEAGNVYVTGSTGTSVYVAKYSPAGAKVWERILGGAGASAGRGIALPAGRGPEADRNAVYVTGSFQGTVDFDPQAAGGELASAGGADAFVLKLTRDGDFVWVRRFGGSGRDIAHGIVADGAVTVVGEFRGSVAAGTAGGEPVYMTSAGGADVFVAQFDSTGRLARTGRAGGPTDDVGTAVAAQGNAVYATGHFTGTAPGLGTSAGGTDGFVMAFKQNGNRLTPDWAGPVGGPGADQGLGIAADNRGVYVTGFFTGTADLDPGRGVFNLTGAGAADAFVLKLDHQGRFGRDGFARQLGGGGADQGRGIAVANGELVATGHFSGTADFDPGPGTAEMTSAGGDDAFVWRLRNDGRFIGATRIGGADEDRGLGVAPDVAGNVYMAGSFTGSVTVDTGAGTFALTSFGDTDLLLTKLVSPLGLRP